jgi:RND superfamily putative drug exporter
MITDGGQQLHDAFIKKAMALRLRAGLVRLEGLVRQNDPAARDREATLREEILKELTRAAQQAERIAEGGRRARAAIDAMLEDPLGREVLDRLLVTLEDLRVHRGLRQAVDFYISPDGRTARFDLTQTDTVFSAGAIDTVDRLRQGLDAFLTGAAGVHAGARFAGTNAEWADIRAQSRADLRRLYLLVPLGTFLVLVVALGDAR